jgi:hypothetical protein
MILGFHGKLGSGKDTAGERMAAIVSLPSQRLSFAAKLKESAAAFFDIDVADWETYKNDPEVQILLTVGYKPALITVDLDETGAIQAQVAEIEEPNVVRAMTAREALQRWGTESHRSIFGDNFWVEQALADYEHDFKKLTYFTDARFENEARAILGMGGHIVRVTGANEETGTHASETVLPQNLITFEIDNTIRDDNFANLDSQLRDLAIFLGLPVNETVSA